MHSLLCLVGLASILCVGIADDGLNRLDSTIHPTILTIPPASQVGQTVVGTLTMSGTAANDTVVTLTSSNPSALSVPSSVTVAAGQSSATFSCTANAASNGVTVTASGSNGHSVSTTVAVFTNQ